MSSRSFLLTAVESLVLTGLALSFLMISNAQVRTSSNYQLESDSINFAGGLSTSSNYSLESTAGEIATGPSDSSSYSLRAGYQQMHEVFISMNVPDNVVMTPNLGGITGGTSNGSTSVKVTTDSSSGYALTMVALNSPAMQKGADTIADYLPVASPDPDLSFALSSSSVHFGFTPYGPDVVTRYQNDGLTCNAAGSSEALKCWDGASTTALLIASGSANQPDGATTTLYFRVGIGGGVVVPPGDYIATTTLTALPL